MTDSAPRPPFYERVLRRLLPPLFRTLDEQRARLDRQRDELDADRGQAEQTRRQLREALAELETRGRNSNETLSQSAEAAREEARARAEALAAALHQAHQRHDELQHTVSSLEADADRRSARVAAALEELREAQRAEHSALRGENAAELAASRAAHEQALRGEREDRTAAVRRLDETLTSAQRQAAVERQALEQRHDEALGRMRQGIDSGLATQAAEIAAARREHAEAFAQWQRELRETKLSLGTEIREAGALQAAELAKAGQSAELRAEALEKSLDETRANLAHALERQSSAFNDLLQRGLADGRALVTELSERLDRADAAAHARHAEETEHREAARRGEAQLREEFQRRLQQLQESVEETRRLFAGLREDNEMRHATLSSQLIADLEKREGAFADLEALQAESLRRADEAARGFAGLRVEAAERFAALRALIDEAREAQQQAGAQLDADLRAKFSQQLASLHESSEEARKVISTLRHDNEARIAALAAELYSDSEVRNATFTQMQIRQMEEIQRTDATMHRMMETMQTELAHTNSEHEHRHADLSGRVLNDLATLKSRVDDLVNPADGLDYAAFEARFRGSEELIRERQRIYLPLVEGRTPIADLGCGRGELVQLMSEAGLEVIGVENNPGQLAACRARSLPVEEADLFLWLEARAPESLGAITCLQVIEHLPLREQRRLIALAHRALKPGGMLLFETVNPHCPEGFEWFYIDPTHQRPVYPEMLDFLMDLAGFGDLTLRYQIPCTTAPPDQPLTATTGADFALWGFKS